jgi:hypothetical protein
LNLDLEKQLQESGVSISPISKSQKVKLLARWTKVFPELVQAARHGRRVALIVRQDNAADARYRMLRNQEFFVLPDDPSGMPSYLCHAETMPDLCELVSDTITQCDELVILATDFGWCAVLVNHGSPQLVARYFQDRGDT